MSDLTFSDDDRAFIRAILSNPAELTAWLVYADWLDEHDQPAHAEYLRLAVRITSSEITQTERFGMIGRWEDLRSALDPDWIAIFDRQRIENCDERFEFRCPKKWEKLKGTADPTVRDCDSCRKKVYYCRSMREAYAHAQQGDCVAIVEGISRFSGDLEHDPDVKTIGLMRMPDPEPPPEPRRPWWKFW